MGIRQWKNPSSEFRLEEPRNDFHVIMDNRVLLLMAEIRLTTWDGAETLKNDGINYQPQLVQDFSHQ